MRLLLLLLAFAACRDSSAAPSPVQVPSAPYVPMGVPPPADANPDAILPLPPIPDAIPMDAVGIPK